MDKKITPFLWFVDNAEEAVKFYTSLFGGGMIEMLQHYPQEAGPMAGKVMMCEFKLGELYFKAFDAGPHHSFTPAISFFVETETQDKVQEYWDALAKDGEILMPLDKYPFSDKYGWIQDKFGISWQIMLGKPGNDKVYPSLLYVKQNYGKAEQAMEKYTSVFPNSAIAAISRYGEEVPGEDPNAISHAKFSLMGQDFVAMESNQDHKFDFTDAISLFVTCEDQAEVDKYWNALSASAENEQCGWLKDAYGVSWQIIPKQLMKLMSDPNPAKAQAVTQAMLKMKKIVVAELEEAYNNA